MKSGKISLILFSTLVFASSCKGADLMAEVNVLLKA